MTSKAKAKTPLRRTKKVTNSESPGRKTPTGDKQAFDQLLDDAIFGVPKTKTGK